MPAHGTETRVWLVPPPRAEAGVRDADRHRPGRVRDPVPTPIADAESPHGLGRRETRTRRLLATADVLAGAAALALAIDIIGNDSLSPMALIGLPIVVLLSKVIGLYDRDESLISKTTLDEAPAVLVLSMLYTLAIWLLAPLFVDGFLGRAQVFGLCATLFALTICFRKAARSITGRLSRERCVAVGDPAECRRLAQKLANVDTAELVDIIPVEEDRAAGYREDAPAAENGRFTPPPALELDLLALPDRLLTLQADRVIIAPRHADTDEVLELIRVVKSAGIRVSVVPRVLDIVGSSVEPDQIEGLPVLGVRRFGITRSSRFVKRAFDVLGSSGLLLLSAPAFAVIAVAIKLDGRGPVFFRQTRVGRDGSHFAMVKFRTMRDGADEEQRQLMDLNEGVGGLFKIADDPRVTRVGKLLRRSSIDELPQLWNVLRGEMSLVGPRPLPVHEDAQIEGWDRRRLHLTPGMTGQWQVLGSRQIPLGEMAKIDYLYVANWSLWTDVKILLRTVPFVIGARGQ